MRQLLACLVHVGVAFPEKRAGRAAMNPKPTPPAPGLAALVDCFRAGDPLPPPNPDPAAGGADAGKAAAGGGSAPSPPRTPPPTPPPGSANVRGSGYRVHGMPARLACQAPFSWSS